MELFFKYFPMGVYGDNNAAKVTLILFIKLAYIFSSIKKAFIGNN